MRKNKFIKSETYRKAAGKTNICGLFISEKDGKEKVKHDFHSFF